MAGKMFGDYDFELQADELKRKQKLIDTLTLKAMQPPVAPEAGRSGQFQVAARLNPLEGLTTALQGYLVGQQRDDLKKERSAFSEQSNQILREDMGRFQESYKTDPQAAMLNALTSRHPMLKQYGMSLLEAKAKDKGKISSTTQGAILYDDEGKLVQLKTPEGSPVGVEQVIRGGDRYGISPSGTGEKKLDDAPKINTSVIVSPVIKGQQAGYEKTFENNAKVVMDLGEQARQAANTLQSLNTLDNLRKDGTYTNVTSGPVTWLSNFAQVANTKIDPTKLGNTETYNAEINKVHQSLIAQMEGGNRGVTKEEAEEIKKQLPLAANSPQAQEKISTILRAGAQRKVQQYKNANKAHNDSLKAQDPSLFSDQFEMVNFPSPNTIEATSTEGKRRKYNPATGRVE